MEIQEKGKKVRQIADKWSNITGNWRVSDYFDLICAFLVRNDLTDDFISFAEEKIEEHRVWEKENQ